MRTREIFQKQGMTVLTGCKGHEGDVLVEWSHHRGGHAGWQDNAMTADVLLVATVAVGDNRVECREAGIAMERGYRVDDLCTSVPGISAIRGCHHA